MILVFDFFKYYMPSVHNNIEAAKYHLDKKNPDYNEANKNLDAADKMLNQAKEATKKEIQRRDKE